jgi:hypothetical protein
MRELSLPAQAYLLACDVEKNRLRDRQRAGYLIRGAALTDLLLRGHLVDNDGVAVAVSGGTAGDEVLAELLGEIARSRPRRWKIWVRMDFRGTLRAVETQLEAAGPWGRESTNPRLPGEEEITSAVPASAETSSPADGA